MYFDARKARALKPGESMLVDGCPGLRLVAAPGWTSWVYRYKNAAGQMKQTSFGRWPAMGAAEAVARWTELRNGKAAGADPVQARRAARQQAQKPAPAEPTVRSIVDDFLREVLASTRSASSLQAAQRALYRLLDEEPQLAALPPDSVTRTMAFELLLARSDRPTATAKLRSLLGSAWDHALDAGRIQEATPNWWRQIMHGRLRSRGKIVDGEHQGRAHVVLSLDQVGEVLRWGQDNLHAHGFDLLVMYLWTGARGAEILRLQPQHIGIERGVMWATLPKSLTKNAHVPRAVDLRVPLIGRARRVVAQRLAAVTAARAAGKVAPMWPDSKGQPYTQKAFSTAVYDLMPDSPKGQRRGGTGWPVPGWSAHRLRATARTLLAQLGCPREVGEAVLGHLPPEVEGTYNRHSYDAERVAWLRKLARALESAAAPLRP